MVKTSHARIALVVAGAALGLTAAGIALLASGGLSPSKDPGVLAMNVVLGVSVPGVAAAIARRQPGHRLAWVLSGAGLGAAVTLFTYAYADYALVISPGALPGGVAVGWMSSWVWTTGVMPLVTFGVLLFPDGRLPSPRWRPAAFAALAGIVLLALSQALAPGPLVDHPIVTNPLGISGAAPALELVGGVGFALFTVAFLAGVASIAVRWHRGHDTLRRQLRWLLYAVAVVGAAFLLDLLAPSPVSSMVVAGALALLPVAVGIAIVREHLYDIDVLISHSMVYGALTAGVVVTYVLVVAALGSLLGRDTGLAGPLLATGIVAVAFQPARERLQRRVARWVYGAQADPYESLARLARRLEASIGADEVLPAVVETVAGTLRLPYVAVELAEEDGFLRVASHGVPTGESTELLLTHQGQTIGRMVLGQREAGTPLTGTERRLLEDLARQAGIAVHGVRLTAALQRSRERLVSAREEERRRLHRDLHDGLGPLLAALTLQLGTLRRLIPADAEAATALAEQLKEDTQAAIPDIRRLVHELRPPALSELGLVAALRQQAVALSAPGPSGRAVAVTVLADGELPALSAATEVAAYRIATEAMTNTLRHAEAHHCTVRVTCNGLLHVDIVDDGCGIPKHPTLGVGLGSMRERAAELGGNCTIERGPHGGTVVHTSLPLGTP
jgi:two-component system, NarL family, sensor kinase